MVQLTAPGGEFELRSVDRGDGRPPVDLFVRGPASLTEAFDRLRSYGDREALLYEGERTTYAQLVEQAESLAGSLHAMGVGPGDRVALAMRNFPEWPIAFWGVQLLGAVAVPLNAWSSDRELEEVLLRVGPAAVVADQERLDRLLAVDRAGVAAPHWISVRAREAPGVVPLEELVSSGSRIPPEVGVRPSPDDHATIVFTSGTTSAPKAVIGTHLNHTAALLSMQLRGRAREVVSGERAGGGKTILVTFPLFHIAGVVAMTGAALAGSRMILMRKWDPELALGIIAQERVAEVYGPAAVAQELVRVAIDRGADLPSLRLIAGGGAMTPPAHVRRVDDHFARRVACSTGYGLTETTSSAITIAAQDFVENPTSIGRPLPGVRARVVGPDGQALPAGEVGELQVSGAIVSPGYLDDPGGTAATFRDGWFGSGDLAVVTDDGRFELRGRSKDVVIRGGENVSCAEVEGVLAEHPDVLEAAVVGRPDDRLGEEVSALVRKREGAHLTAESLTDFLRPRLAHFKVPTEIVVTDRPLARTATGKLHKPTVAAELTAQRLC
jgi:long-chain acyl-CoA synthetase